MFVKYLVSYEQKKQRVVVVMYISLFTSTIYSEQYSNTFLRILISLYMPIFNLITDIYRLKIVSLKDIFTFTNLMT